MKTDIHFWLLIDYYTGDAALSFQKKKKTGKKLANVRFPHSHD